MSLVLVVTVAVFLDVRLKLRAEGLEKEEADKTGSSDLASTTAEDLGDRVDDRHEGEEGEDDDEHDDGTEGFHCSSFSERVDCEEQVIVDDGFRSNRDETSICTDIDGWDGEIIDSAETLVYNDKILSEGSPIR